MSDEKKKMSEEEILELIEPTQEDFISRRINHIPFAKVVYWLNVQSKKQDFIYASELSSFMKVTQTRAYTVLRDLCKAGIMHRKSSSSSMEFYFSKNGGNTIISKYLEKAKKTLDLD